MNIDYSTVFSLAPFVNENIVTIIGICLLIGAMAKSSQVGLHVWLPMAMEGPTPVSALIHAATMVTAGVYLLMRTSPLIEYSSTVLILCLWLGAITTVFSSLIGLFQQDIKKVIAYSTMSQLAREFLKFRHQTICVEIILATLAQDRIINSQITKARDIALTALALQNMPKAWLWHYHINFNLFNSFTTMWLHNIMFEKRKVKIISKLVGISEAIRLILIFLMQSNNLKIFTGLNSSILIQNSPAFYIVYNKESKAAMSCLPSRAKIQKQNIQLNKSSIYSFDALTLLQNTEEEAIQSKSCSLQISKSGHTKEDLNSLKFNEWLAGLIDGDGYFILTKKNYTSCEICMDIRDKKALYEVKHKYGGSIKPVSGAKALKYKLRNRKGLVSLINNINGLVRNPTRLLQMNKLCDKYKIELKYPKPLTYDNGWLSGFIDSDGSIYLNEKSGQIFISITQKNRFLLEPLIQLYGGRIDILSPKIEAFKYVIYRKNELYSLLDNYFINYPLKTEKYKRVNLIRQFYDLRTYNNNKNNNDINKLNAWVSYKDRWEKYLD